MRLNLFKILILAGGLSLSACNAKVMKESAKPDGGVSKGKPTAAITFADVKTRVLDSACIRCHSEFKTYQSLMDDVVAGDALSSNLYTNLQNVGGNMPKGTSIMIPDADAALIRDWIDSGAPEFLSAPVGAPTAPIATPTPNPVRPPGPVYFDEVKTKVFDAKCSHCHGAGSDNGDFTTYATVMGFVKPGDFLKSKVVSELQNFGGEMPKGGTPLSPDELALLKTWIETGSLESAQTPVPTPVPTPAATPSSGVPTFADIQGRILLPKCVMCHSDKQMVSNFSLEHYDAVVANARLIDLKSPDASGIYASVVDDFMPYKAAVAKGTVQVLTSAEKALLKTWVEAGAPE